MIFLHGTFVERPGEGRNASPGFLLWGERSRPAPDGASGAHPWALDAHGLARFSAGIKTFLPDGLLPEPARANVPPSPPKRGRKPKKAADGKNGENPSVGPLSFFVTLPTAGGLPLPSSPLVADVPPGRKRPVPQAWMAEGLVFSPRGSVRFLAALSRLPVGDILLQPEEGTDAERVRYAPDLEFCLTLLRFVGGMAARQNFLPSVRISPDGTARAVWEPVFVGLERDRFEAMIRSVPPLCRAAGPTAESAPPSSRRFVAETLDMLMDAFVRLDMPPATGSGVAAESVHRKWIDGLTHAAEPEADPALAGLALQLKKWRNPLTAAADAPYRLCLQLEEPEPDEDAGAADRKDLTGLDAEWNLACYVQPVDDPTLQVRVESILAPRTKRDEESLKLLTRRQAMKPQEFAPLALWQAGKLYPPVENALRGAAFSRCDLTPEAAFRFLEHDAASLIEAGFVVRFPSWWTAKGYRKLFGLKASVSGGKGKLSAPAKLSLDGLLKVDWDLMLDGTPISVEELERLAAMKDTMVRVRGRWVALSREELQKALNFLKKAPREASVRDIVKTSLQGDEDFAPAAVEFGGKAAFAEMLATLAGKTGISRLPSPEGLKAELRPYQMRGFSWLAFLSRWGLGACLADDMGLGKTLQTLALVQNRVNGGESRPALLVAPTSVLENWRREAERFLPGLRVHVHHGAKRTKSDDFVAEAAACDLMATSYALLVRDRSLLSKVRWSGVILDEAQNVKNPDSGQARAARQLCSDYRIALTGTPVENHVGDLRSLMEFLNPGLLGSEAAFRRRFFNPIQKEHDPQAAARLRDITGPFVLRRLKTDRTIIDDLPEKIVTKTFCRLKKEQATLYAAAVKETERAIEEAEGIQRRGLVLATLTRLKQICNHPAQYLGESGVGLSGRSGKLERLEELAAEAIEAGDRLLVFTQYAEMGALLKRHLQETLGEETFLLHGGVPKAARDAMVRRFQEEEDGARLFVLSLKAGGTGLNLTRANHVVLFDRWWNPAVEQQAIDRAFRIGQKKNVQVHAFVCQGTMEEQIDAMIESKQEIAGMTVKSGESWLTELSAVELKDLFALRQSAVDPA